jgi:hypothetical protein
VAVSPLGGFYAITRDPSRLVRRPTDATGRPAIYVRTADGKALATIQHDDGVVRALGWTFRGHLLVVNHLGQVYHYDAFGYPEGRPFSLGESCRRAGVASVRMLPNAVFVLSMDENIYAVVDLDDPRVITIPNVKSCKMTSWGVVPRNVRDPVAVLLGTTTGVIVADLHGHREVELKIAPVQFIAASPTGSFVAIASADHVVRVFLPDFNTILTESRIMTQRDESFRGLAWIGSDAVAVLLNTRIHVVGPTGHSADVDLQGHYTTISEHDSLRVIDQSCHSILQQVPQTTINTSNLSAGHPGAILFQANLLFERGDPQSDCLLRSIRDNRDLLRAVQTCISAAEFALTSKEQKFLLRCALLGMQSLDRPRVALNLISKCANICRLVATCQDAEIKLPITGGDIRREGYALVLRNLLCTRNHDLAFAVRYHDSSTYALLAFSRIICRVDIYIDQILAGC